MSVVSHATVHSTPTLFAIFQAKIPVAIFIDVSSTCVNYGFDWIGQNSLVDWVDFDSFW